MPVRAKGVRAISMPAVVRLRVVLSPQPAAARRLADTAHRDPIVTILMHPLFVL